MLYRITGQFKTNYRSDYALFPVRQDMFLLAVILFFAWVVFPLMASEFAFQTLLIPVLIYALAALGLNILTGYAGQLSLGTGAFMGVGAYACYKLVTIFPDLNLMLAIGFSGLFSAAIGLAFGLPSLRIKGFYLAIATLAAQFFLVWLFEKWSWLYNYNASGAIQVPTIDMFGITVSGPTASSMVQYYFVQIDRLWCLVVYCRCFGCPVRVFVARCSRAKPLRYSPVIQNSVYRHYRRTGVHIGQFSWRHPDHRASGYPEYHSGSLWRGS